MGIEAEGGFCHPGHPGEKKSVTVWGEISSMGWWCVSSRSEKGCRGDKDGSYLRGATSASEEVEVQEPLEEKNRFDRGLSANLEEPLMSQRKIKQRIPRSHFD